MTTHEFLAESLRLRGYDGLVLEEESCGCLLCDLEPCGRVRLSLCKPAYKQICAGCGDSMMTTERDPGTVYCGNCEEPANGV